MVRNELPFFSSKVTLEKPFTIYSKDTITETFRLSKIYSRLHLVVKPIWKLQEGENYSFCAVKRFCFNPHNLSSYWMLLKIQTKQTDFGEWHRCWLKKKTSGKVVLETEFVKDKRLDQIQSMEILCQSQVLVKQLIDSGKELDNPSHARGQTFNASSSNISDELPRWTFFLTYFRVAARLKAWTRNKVKWSKKKNFISQLNLHHESKECTFSIMEWRKWNATPRTPLHFFREKRYWTSHLN